MAAEAGFLPPVGVSCADMKFGMVTVSDGKTKPQPVCFQVFEMNISGAFYFITQMVQLDGRESRVIGSFADRLVLRMST